MRYLSLSPLSLEETDPPRMDSRECTDQFAAMKQLEEGTYSDYLVDNAERLKMADKPVDAECRLIFCEWSYPVIDYFECRRVSVNLAMLYLDSFLRTECGRDALVDRREYQLAAMTCLFIVLKIHESLAIKTSHLSEMSKGIYDKDEFVKMEQRILSSLNWRLNCPTSLDFVQVLMGFLPKEVNPSVAAVMMDYARYQTELVVAEYAFVPTKPSMIAFAAILNAMEGMDDELVPNSAREEFLRTTESCTGMVASTAEATQSLMTLMLLRSEGASLLRSEDTFLQTCESVSEILDPDDFFDPFFKSQQDLTASPVSAAHNNGGATRTFEEDTRTIQNLGVY